MNVLKLIKSQTFILFLLIDVLSLKLNALVKLISFFLKNYFVELYLIVTTVPDRKESVYNTSIIIFYSTLVLKYENTSLWNMPINSKRKH